MRLNFHLLGIALVVVVAVVLDVLLFYYRPPNAFAFLVVADGVILAGLAVDVAYRLRQRRADYELFRRLAESSPLTKSPGPASPAEKPEPDNEVTVFVYHDSPKGLEFPGFICTCGHPHQFLCLTCNMTAEKARQTAGIKWIEWTLDMKEPNN